MIAVQPFPPDAPVTIHTYSARFTSAAEWAAFGNGGAPSTGTITQNQAYYFPLRLPFAYPVKRIWWYNGSTVNGNTDVGIYRADNFGLVGSTGATLQAGTNAIQYVTVDWLLPAGEYYFALSTSSATSQYFRNTANFTSQSLRLFGVLIQSSAHPLPSSMTPASAGATTSGILFGVTRYASFP